MIYLFFVLLVLFFFTVAAVVYINSRLFVYIKNLEKIVQEQVDKNDNMFRSLKELVQDDFLLSDGRLRKFVYQKERNKIYNGVRIEENDIEI